MSKWIKKGDNVLVLTGNDKGRTGKVIKRMPTKVLIEGINLRKKHVKRTQQAQSAQIVDIEMPIHISNVSLCDPEGNKIKVKVKDTDNKKRDLVYLKKDKEVVLRTIRKEKGKVNG